MKTDRPFKAGDEVALISGGWSRMIWRKGKVSKVYKNGNFVLEGERQQYRPDGYCTGDGYHRGSVVHIDDPVVQEIELEKEFRSLASCIEDAGREIRQIEPTQENVQKLKKVLRVIRTIQEKAE